MSSPTSNDIQLSGFMRKKDVLKLIPISKATWSAGVKRGIYPQPYHPSAGTSAWKRSDIADLIEQISNGKMKQ